MDTYFAPAGRDTDEELVRRIGVLKNVPLLQTAIDALPTPVAILNESRQILAVNPALLRMLNKDAASVLGLRTGEVAGCAYSNEAPDGCGTTKRCLTCGAVAAVLQSQRTSGLATHECRMTLDTAVDGGARDLRVTASAMDIQDERVTMCTIQDISQQKRLKVLSRVFFHDVLNTAGGIQGYITHLEEDAGKDSRALQEVRQLSSLAEQLINEIESQRDLTLAESGDLEVAPTPVHTVELLEDLRTLYSDHPVANGRNIDTVDIWDGRLITDARLLARVLGNMLKNALEASKVGVTVTLRCILLDGHVAFSVHNPSVMTDEVKLQVFHRSFSTKSHTGRGIGTYSMRLLGEHYLGGKVEFESEPRKGTTFTVVLPRVFSMLRKTAE